MTQFDWESMKRQVAGVFEQTRDQTAINAIFQERARALAQRSHQARASEASWHLLFDVGNVRFALPFEDVRSIAPLQWVTRIPGAPEFKCRVTHLAGRIVSLVDLSGLLQLGELEVPVRDDRCLLLEHAGSHLGLLVNELRGIEEIDTGDLNPPAQGTHGDFVRGIAKGLVLVLDGKRIVASLRDGKTTDSQHAGD